MSKVLATVSKVAGIVSTVAAFIPGGQVIAAAAAAVAAITAIGAQLTAKKPPARGNTNQTIIESDAPSPYLMGRSYSGGVMRHETGYGPTLKKVPNPYYGRVCVYSVAGPLAALIAVTADYKALAHSEPAISGYYSGHLYASTQKGQSPEPSALVPHFAPMDGWGSSSKLSGQAAILWNALFDNDGKIFASGMPILGAIWEGVKVYDPRKDSTYPGGSGGHILGNETTYEYSENPALHAITYLYGRYQNGSKVFGLGLSADAIDMATFVALANICDANGWKIGGTIYEPGDKWNNLKQILQTASAEPVLTGGGVSVKYNAPRVSVDTITVDDLWDDLASVPGMKPWAQRLNGIIPKYRSEPHNWNYVKTEIVSVPAYVTADGEKKELERQYNLVQQANQAAQLAAYELVDGREISPIQIACKPRLRQYRAGDCLTLNIPDAGLVNQKAIVLSRTVEPSTGKVSFTFETETAEKHAFALGQTATAPPTPGIRSLEDRDDVASALGLTIAVQAEIDAALALAASRGKIWYQNTAPTLAESNVGDTWVPSSGVLYQRIDAQLTLGGNVLTLGGDRLSLYWTRWQAQPLEEALLRGTKAIADAVAAQAVADAATDRIAAYDDDGVLDISEKLNLRREDAALEAAYQSIILAAATVNVSSADVTANRSAWLAVRNAISPAWNNIDVDSPVDRNSLDASLYNYRDSIEKLRKNIEAANNGLAALADGKADQALQDAADAQADADTASAAAAQANTRLGVIANDDVLSPDEKPDAVQARDLILAEQAGIVAEADRLAITTAKTDYQSAITALTTYLATLTTPVAWDSLAGDTNISGTVFRGKFNDVFGKRQVLLNKIAEILKLSANAAALTSTWDGTTGIGKPEDNATRQVPVGIYSAAATYVKGDILLWPKADGGDGSSYQRIGTGSTTGVTPSDATKWEKLVEAGEQGDEGQSYGNIYQRNASTPSTPEPSAGTPSGWYETTAEVPSGSAPMWASPWSRASGSVNRVFQDAYRNEAVSVANTGQFLTLGFSVSSILTFALAPGQSRIATGDALFSNPIGTGSVYIQIEYRKAGGSWAAVNGSPDAYIAGEPVAPRVQATITNSTTNAASYEVRGTIIRSNSNSGNFTAANTQLVI